MKDLNIRQGLFRLWVIASVLFVVGVGVVSYRGIREEFRIAYTDWDAMSHTVHLVGVGAGEQWGPSN
jgi:hypothetical protein